MTIPALSHPGKPGKLSQIMFCSKLCYAAKRNAIQTVDRWFKDSSFHVLLTSVIKELYRAINSNLQLNISRCCCVNIPSLGGKHAAPALKLDLFRGDWVFRCCTI